MMLSKGGWKWDTMPKCTKPSIHYPVVTTKKITFKPRSRSLCLNLSVLLLVFLLKAAAILLPTSERQVLPQSYVILQAKN